MHNVRHAGRMATAIAFCIFLVIALGGCAATQSSDTGSPDPESASSGSSAASVSLPTIGEGASAMQATNQTGYDIIGVRVKASDQKSYAPEDSFDGSLFGNGETVDILYDQIPGAVTYDVLLLTSEDSKIAVRGIDVDNAENLVFHFEDGLGFVTYTDRKTGKAADNKAAALSMENGDVVPYDVIHQEG